MKATLFEKSQETEEHAQRMIKLSRDIGRKMKLKDEQLNELEILSTLHDIGKIGISGAILSLLLYRTAEVGFIGIIEGGLTELQLVTIDNLAPNIKLYPNLGCIARFGYIPQPPKGETFYSKHSSKLYFFSYASLVLIPNNIIRTIFIIKEHSAWALAVVRVIKFYSSEESLH